LILGGSHSAYAVADALLGLSAADRLAAGQIEILQRREPRVFYPDRNAACDDLYDVDPGDICPRTQRVNRMGGLRGYGREMWRRCAAADACLRRVAAVDAAVLRRCAARRWCGRPWSSLRLSFGNAAGLRCARRGRRSTLMQGAAGRGQPAAG
jgi:hypothetical protein